MAERQRSKDGKRETEKFTEGKEGVSQQGRSGGDLQRDVGTQNSEERAEHGEDRTTRVRGEDKRNHGGTP